MIGNDVVWLGDLANLGRHKDLRLVDRILSLAEKDYLTGSSDPDRLLWSLWAAKEAAFKSLSKSNPRIVFSPKAFQVHVNLPAGSGTVTHRESVLPFAWFHGFDWVEAVAGLPADEIFHFVSPSSRDESESVRSLAVRCLSSEGWPSGGAVKGRPPQYFVGGKALPVDLSLSHDGPYSAVAFRRFNWINAPHP